MYTSFLPLILVHSEIEFLGWGKIVKKSVSSSLDNFIPCHKHMTVSMYYDAVQPLQTLSI